MTYKMGSLILLSDPTIKIIEKDEMWNDGEVMNEMDEILPNLWLGGYPRDSAKEFTRIFCVTSDGTGPQGTNSSQIVIRCALHDTCSMPPIATIEAIADMVNREVDAGHKTLVHCTQGINRSGLIVALALMKKGWTADNAIDHLRKCRSKYVLMNDTFSTWLKLRD